MCSTVNCEHARTFPNAGMHRVDPPLETYELELPLFCLSLSQPTCELARNGNMKTTNTNHPFHKSPLPHHMRRHGIQAGVWVRVRAGRKMMGRIRGELVSVGMEGQTAFLDSRMHDMGPPLHTVERGRAFFHFSIAAHVRARLQCVCAFVRACSQPVCACSCACACVCACGRACHVAGDKGWRAMARTLISRPVTLSLSLSLSLASSLSLSDLCLYSVACRPTHGMGP